MLILLKRESLHYLQWMQGFGRFYARVWTFVTKFGNLSGLVLIV